MYKEKRYHINKSAIIFHTWFLSIWLMWASLFFWFPTFFWYKKQFPVLTTADHPMICVRTHGAQHPPGPSAVAAMVEPHPGPSVWSSGSRVRMVVSGCFQFQERLVFKGHAWKSKKKDSSKVETLNLFAPVGFILFTFGFCWCLRNPKNPEDKMAQSFFFLSFFSVYLSTLVPPGRCFSHQIQPFPRCNFGWRCWCLAPAADKAAAGGLASCWTKVDVWMLKKMVFEVRRWSENTKKSDGFTGWFIWDRYLLFHFIFSPLTYMGCFTFVVLNLPIPVP